MKPAPKPTREQRLIDQIRDRQKRFIELGGTRCHCGGLVYPTIDGDRFTCMHGPRVTPAQMDAFWGRSE